MNNIIKPYLPALFFVLINIVPHLNLLGQFSNFPGKTDLSIEDDIFGGNYEIIAGRTIQSDRIISDEANVQFIAGEVIKLTKGFKVDKNCLFKARLIKNNEILSRSDENLIFNKNSINVYPSVSEGIIYFELNNNYNECTIQIFNSSGVLIHSDKYVNESKKIIDLTGVSEGIYLMRVKINEETYLKKLVIK